MERKDIFGSSCNPTKRKSFTKSQLLSGGIGYGHDNIENNSVFAATKGNTILRQIVWIEINAGFKWFLAIATTTQTILIKIRHCYTK